MSYVVHYGDQVSGWVFGTLAVDACRVSDELRQASSFAAHVPVSRAREAWAKLDHGPADMWLVAWQDEFSSRLIAGGPLLPTSFDADGLDLSGAGLWWHFRNRLAVHRNWTPSTPGGAAAPIWSMSGWDLGTLQRYLCWETSAGPASQGVYQAQLPIVWPATRGGSHERTYQPYDLVTVAQRVEELGSVEAGTDGKGGPDWAFLPSWDPALGSVFAQWAFLSGTQAQPMLFGDDDPLILDASAPGQRLLRNLTGARDGSRRATRVFASGGGTEYTKVIEVAEAEAPDIRVDAVVTNDALDIATVQGYADDGLARRSATPSALTVDVDAAWWWVNDGKVGKPVRLLWADHPIVGDLDVTTRVTKWDADVNDPWVKLTLADTTVSI